MKKIKMVEVKSPDFEGVKVYTEFGSEELEKMRDSIRKERYLTFSMSTKIAGVDTPHKSGELSCTHSRWNSNLSLGKRGSGLIMVW